MVWTRYWFECPAEDPRPLVFPPPGPFWVTGEGEEYFTLVAYLPVQQTAEALDPLLLSYWPEARAVEWALEEDITFSSRFPCPSWWQADRKGNG